MSTTIGLSPQQITGALDRSAFTPRHSIMYASVILGHLFDGFDINMMGTVLPGISREFHLTPALAGYLASSVFVGMLVGSAIVGMLADRIGRKRALLFAVLFYGTLSLITATAWSYRSLVAMRMIEGFGLGAEVPLVFTYLSEFIPVRQRGVLLASSVFFWQFASFLAALAATYVIPAYGWRGMFVVGGLPSFIVAFLIGRLPESSRFMIAAGRVAEAEHVVRWLSTVPPDQVPTAAPEPGGERRLRDLMSPGYARATISVWIMHFCGGAVFFGLGVWLPTVFVHMGFPLVRSFYFTAAITGAGALGNLAGGLLLDRLGRRPTLTAFFLLGGLFMLAWSQADGALTIVTLGAATAFFGAGGAGGPLFTYTSEIFPTRFRGTGVGWAAGWQRIGGILAPSALGLLLASHPSSVVFFGVLAVVLLVGAVTMFTLGFETRGKSLEQINASLRGAPG
jgi:MFS transporter, putative metabolite:H+ symporter